MKLIIITAVEEFSDNIKQILQLSEIHVFSFTEIVGFKSSSKKAEIENWFPGERHENNSIMFYAFVKKEDTNVLFKKIEDFNLQQTSLSRIHIAVLSVEKSND